MSGVRDTRSALQPGAEWLTAIVDASEDAIYSRRLDGVVLSWNPGAERLLGYSAQEIIGRPAQITIPPDRHAEFAATAEKIARGDVVEIDDTERLRKDGTRASVSLRLAPIRSIDDQIIAVCGVMRDIGKLKQAEQALRASERRFRDVAANFPGIVFRRITYPDGRVEYPYASKGAGQAFGLSEADIASVRTVDDLARYCSPDDLRKWWAKAQEAAAASAPLNIEGRLHCPDGKIRWFHSVSQPTPRADGATVWDGVTLDVTAQKEAHERLEARTAQLDTILETAPALLWIAHDPEAQHIIGSRYAAQLLKLPDEANQSKSASEQQRPQHFRVLKDGRELRDRDLPVQRAARGEEVRGEELQVVFDDGSSFWELVNASPVRDKAGRVIGAIGAGVVIDERKAAEQRQLLWMAELNHRVKNLFAGVQAIVMNTLRSKPEADVLLGRIAALAQAHSSLSAREWRGAELREVIDGVLAAHVDGSRRAVLDGPSVLLPANLAQNLAIVLHELTTNAAKYGALSAPDGRIEVRWSVLASPARLRLSWAETGGPPVAPPGRRGFGTDLIERSLSFEFDAKVDMQFEQRGLRCEIELPLPQA